MQANAQLHRRLATKSRVFAACEQLGDDVSARNVRALLGGGSMRDITQHLKAWRSIGSETAGEQTPANTAIASSNVIHIQIEEGLARIEERLQSQVGRFDQWREVSHREIRALRAELVELVTSLRLDRQPAPSSAVIPLGRADAVPREINAAIDRIHRRLDDLERAVHEQQAPAVLVSGSLNQLTEQMGVLATQLFRMNQWLEANEKAASERLDDRVARLSDGQEALAETIGHVHQNGIALLADALVKIDRSQAGRIGRLRSLVSKSPPRAASSRSKPTSSTSKGQRRRG